MNRETKWKSKRGFSIVGVLIAMAMVVSLFLGVSELLSFTTRFQRTMEYRNDLLLIKTRMMTELDCARTLTAAGITDPATQCSTIPHFDLRNKADAVIGGAVGSGIFVNSRQMEGMWYYRATCDATNQTLVLQLARQGPTVGTFGEDPQFKEPYDWDYPRGTMFGPNAKFCGQQLGGGGGGPVGPSNFISADLVDTGVGCYLSISRDDDGNPQIDGRIYSATATCPVGQTVSSGGIICAVPGLSPNRSLVTSSGPDSTGTGWVGSCCIHNGQFNAANHKVYAACQ